MVAEKAVAERDVFDSLVIINADDIKDTVSRLRNYVYGNEEEGHGEVTAEAEVEPGSEAMENESEERETFGMDSADAVGGDDITVQATEPVGGDDVQMADSDSRIPLEATTEEQESI